MSTQNNYKDEYYREVDGLFATIKPNPFHNPENQTPYESEDVGQIQPTGWVQNASGSDGEATVIIDGDGITVLDGAITVTNAGATVIIDGTSEMFRVAVTGSINTGSVSDDSSAVNTVTHTGLYLDQTPALISFLGVAIDDKAARSSGHFIGNNTGAVQPYYAAISSGGTTTTKFRAMVEYAFTTVVLNGTDEPVISIYGINSSGGARTYYARYYVMDLVAI